MSPHPFLDIRMLPQPDDVTCGPTCLQAVYRHLGHPLELEQIIAEVRGLPEGGTLAVYLGNHALKRGLKARLYSYHLKIFDPSWRGLPPGELAAKLEAQLAYKHGKKFETASRAYIRFLELGGEIALDDLTSQVFDAPFNAGLPILTGLSATYLYDSRREYTNRHNRAVYDDLRGEPTGHFVVLCGRERGKVRVADPYIGNPLADDSHYYDVRVNRLIRAILLGVMTYDANLLVISDGDLP
ncbi:MAG TPA: peptidase-C39 like family protein [Gammaproteobacteria bacterium]|nr:peptidase-C39 like family protein [Gammaproteobacteria bacterium]HRP88353.1 peptidase-C39 like family protein [Gammaproteobacteria bacterium]